MRIFLFILTLAFLVIASTHTWDNGGSDGDGWNAANYDPEVSDWNTSALVFDNTSDDAVTFGASDTVLSITTTSDYDGNMTNAGYTIYILGDAIMDGTGTKHIGNGFCFLGSSGTFHIGSGSGAVTGSSHICDWIGCATGTLDWDKFFYFKRLQLLNSHVTNTGAGGNETWTTLPPLIMLGGSRLTFTSVMGFGLSGDTTMYQITSTDTLNGTATTYFFTSSAASVGCPKMIATTPTILFTFSGGSKVRYMDSLNVRNLRLGFNGPVDTVRLTNTWAKYFYTVVNYTNASPTRLFFGDNTYSCDSLVFLHQGTHTGPLHCYLDTADITTSGNISVDGYTTFYPMLSRFTVDSAGQITSNNQRFHNLNINASGKTVTAADRIYADSCWVTAGTLATGGAGDDTLLYMDIDAGLTAEADTVQSNYIDIATGATITTDAASLWRIGDGGTIKMGGKSLPVVSALGNVTWYDGGTIANFLTAGTGLDTVKYEPLKKYTFTAADSANWNGADATHRNVFRSTTAGQRCTLDFNATKWFSYTAWKDVVSADTIFLNDGTNINLGGCLWP